MAAFPDNLFDLLEYDYFDGCPPDAIAEHERRVRHQEFVRVHLRDVHNTFDVSIECFVELYRVPQDVCIELINLLTPFITVKNSRSSDGKNFHDMMHQRRAVRSTIPIYMRVLCSLYYYATGCYQEHVGTSMFHTMSQASVSYSIQEVTQALQHPLILKTFIRFPSTHAERVEKTERNARLGLPGVLGIVDGTLIRITHSPKPHQHYFSRKHFVSLNAMIVCDVDLNILNVNARFPGSCHDSWVYRSSPIDEVMQEAFREDQCYPLGASRYPHRPWLMTPILNAPPDTPEYLYTKLHCRCRNPVERCIGVLKARWRCLSNDRAISYRSETT
ncbi:Putative nuclease [Frankliniella fusca]|uniref:Nuclease n=1 Tax=Frankliniella fusca TaxID=407009 RepID=A0AAE1HX54_9NEOP|nr:Putative nuclease [Frankliniella fusca]